MKVTKIYSGRIEKIIAEILKAKTVVILSAPDLDHNCDICGKQLGAVLSWRGKERKIRSYIIYTSNKTFKKCPDSEEFLSWSGEGIFGSACWNKIKDQLGDKKIFNVRH